MGFEYRIHDCNSGCEEPHVDEHRDDCSCEACHEGHQDEGMQLWDGFAECCTYEINFEVSKGRWCKTHRRPFEGVGFCEGCQEESIAEAEGGHSDDRPE